MPLPSEFPNVVHLAVVTFSVAITGINAPVGVRDSVTAPIFLRVRVGSLVIARGYSEVKFNGLAIKWAK